MANETQTEMPFSRWSAPLLPLLRPFRAPLCWAFLAMLLDAFLTALRPWPLKVVIDLVLAHRNTRVPFIGRWLNEFSATPRHIVSVSAAAYSNGELALFFPLQALAQLNSCETSIRSIVLGTNVDPG